MSTQVPDQEAFAGLLGNAMPGPLERGTKLARDGAVELGESLGDIVSARVQGTSTYRVVLGTTARGSWSCTCMAASDGSFCKHCVATACIVSGVVAAPTKDDADDGPRAERAKIEEHVRSLGADALLAIVLDQIDVDAGLAHRLLADAMASDGEAVNLAEWRKKVTAAFRGRGGHVERRHAAEWARGVHDILDSLWSFLGAGYASEVAALAEHAHRRNESAVNRVDDSGGQIHDLMAAIAELHYAAAEAGAYTPKKLGARLVELELKADLDTFHRSAVTYAGLLGEDGLAAYEKGLVKAAPDGPQALPRYSGFRVRQAYIAHAVASEDPDRLITLFEQSERASASDFAELVRLLMAVGRVDDAATWADRGLEQTAGSLNRSELQELRADLLQAAPGGAEAVEELYWGEFERSASASSTRDVLENAIDESSMRERILGSVEVVLEQFRQVPVRESDFRQRGLSNAPVGSVGAISRIHSGRGAQFDGTDSVIAVLIELGEVDRAWAVAMEFGAWRSSWETLTDLRRADHPRDALSWALVQAVVEIDHRDKRHYKRAVRVLREAEVLAAQRTTDDDDLAGEFRSKVLSLLGQHGNKPSLINEFAKAGWVPST